MVHRHLNSHLNVPAANDTHDQNEALTTGARLRNAREQLGLSQQAVAERLCLKVSTVRDIEEDKAPADLASTFLRGYIRSYARLVHIPEEIRHPPILLQHSCADISALMRVWYIFQKKNCCQGWKSRLHYGLQKLRLCRVFPSVNAAKNVTAG